ncbi:MAG TPA: HNH endonuclease family protein, partial [Verrucomicrobiae bacterium]|nr:HNH endonuclease family protein [Verrucomicrobiae bacterium]
EDALKIHAELLHTPGNLTLSAYNRQLWNHPFDEKKLQYAQSNVVLTRKLADSSQWGAAEIRARGGMLAKVASEIWTGPKGLSEYA